MKYIKSQKGFTFIEIVIVIALIGMLFFLIIPQVQAAIGKAKETGVMTDFRDFEPASQSLMRETLEKT